MNADITLCLLICVKQQETIALKLTTTANKGNVSVGQEENHKAIQLNQASDFFSPATVGKAAIKK